MIEMNPVTERSSPEEILSALKTSPYWTKLSRDLQDEATKNPATWLQSHPRLFYQYPSFFRELGRMYSLRVLKRRRFHAFKNAMLVCVGRIVARLAGSKWVITHALAGNPPALQSVATRNYPSRRLTLWGHKPENVTGNLRWNHVKLIETEFTPPFQQMPKRPFVMACRPLCGLDLKYPHTSCWTACRIRRAYYGLMAKVQELEAVWAIAPNLDRRNRRVREMLTKQLALIMETCSS
jgi:hypothetical protein